MGAQTGQHMKNGKIKRTLLNKSRKLKPETMLTISITMITILKLKHTCNESKRLKNTACMELTIQKAWSTYKTFG